jgi:glycosyltransferase involved in cell wall biosynthesis/GT2 family glycosyltransferase
MRLVFVSWEYPPEFGGGIGTYVAAMARILAERGHRVTVVSVTSEACPLREQGGSLEVIRLPAPRDLEPGHGEPANTLAHWHARADQVSTLLHRLAAAEPIDAIEFADYRGEALTYLSSTVPGRRPPCVVRLHTPLATLNRYNAAHTRYPLLEAYEAESMRLADRLVSPSRALAREIREAVPGLGEIDILPYPADGDLLRVDGGAVPERPGALFVGRLEQRKGVETLFEALPRYFDACPDATLSLVGGDMYYSDREPSMGARLRAMLPARHAGRVTFHGRLPRDAIVNHYLGARLCVFPSLFENFPNVCLEAMALGRPVIGTDNSGMAEMIEHGESGLIVRAGDADHLAEALIELHAMPRDRRWAMGRAARARVRERYAPERIAAQYEALYRSFAGARVARGPAGGPPTAGHAPAGAPARRLAGTGRTGTPAVAVVIPCFNHGEYLREALASVRAQTWPNVETVVVDDGSTDAGTRATLDSLRAEGVRVIRRENGGLAAARNTGVRATDAPFFVPLDADDLVSPDFIEKLVTPLLADATLGYCYCHCRYFGDGSGVWACPEYLPERLLVGNLSVATAVVRRAAYDQAGGYAEDMRGGFEDWDFWIALLSVGYRGRCVPEPLFHYRQHARGSMLTETQRRRPELIARMIAHHRGLFAGNLAWALTEKDRMFFDAHMDAWRKSQQVAHLSAMPGCAAANGTLSPAEELDGILRSRAWRTVVVLKSNAIYRALARARWGPDWRLPEVQGPPEARLAHIKSSRSYRLIQTMKRTTAYRWYASRKYGHE